MRPSRRGPEFVRESLVTGALLPRGPDVPRGEAGRERWSDRLRRAEYESGAGWRGLPPISILTGRSDRSTRGAHSAGLSRSPNSRSVASSVSLPGIAALSPPDASVQPSRLNPHRLSPSYRLGQTFHRLPSPRRLHQFAIFPQPGQMVLPVNPSEWMSEVGPPGGASREAVTAGYGAASPPHPSQRGCSGYPAFPRGCFAP